MRSIEPGISRFPDAQLRIRGLVLTHQPGMTIELHCHEAAGIGRKEFKIKHLF